MKAYIGVRRDTAADFHPCPPESRYSVFQPLFTFPPLKGRNDASRPAITTTIVNDTAIPTPPAPSSSPFRLRETGPVPRGGHSPAPARSRIYVVRVGHRHPVRAHQLPRGPGGRLAHGPRQGRLRRHPAKEDQGVRRASRRLPHRDLRVPALRNLRTRPAPELRHPQGHLRGGPHPAHPLHPGPGHRARGRQRDRPQGRPHHVPLLLRLPDGHRHRRRRRPPRQAARHRLPLRAAHRHRGDYFPNPASRTPWPPSPPSPAARAPSTSSGSLPSLGAPGASGVPATAASPRAPACPRSWPTWP